MVLEEFERMQILSDLVDKITITEVKLERPSHAHFWAAMVAQFVSCGKPRTQAEVVSCVPAAKARLWAAFVQDAGDYNFVNPAIIAALIRQPGIVNSKRAMEPFLTTGMGKQTTLAMGQAILPVGQAVLHRYSSNRGHEVYSEMGSTASWAST